MENEENIIIKFSRFNVVHPVVIRLFHMLWKTRLNLFTGATRFIDGHYNRHRGKCSLENEINLCRIFFLKKVHSMFA